MILYHVTNYNDCDQWFTSKRAAIKEAKRYCSDEYFADVVKTTISLPMNKKTACLLLSGEGYASHHETIWKFEPTCGVTEWPENCRTSL